LNAKTLAVALLASLDEVIAAAAILFWLPHLGIEVPPSYALAVLAGLALLSYLLYRIIKPVVVKPPIVGVEAMLGLTGEALTMLNPKGLVAVGSEKWKAVSLEGPISEGEKVSVVAVEGLTLKVKKRQPDSSGIL
jgi:membrane-bound serine protease (ClpP class)